MIYPISKLRQHLLKTLVFFGILTVFLVLLTQRLQESPVTQLPNYPVTFLVFGDSGSGSEEQKTLAKLMEKEGAAFALHTGDVVYPCGTEDGYISKFRDVYAGFIAKAVIYPAPGNHDYQCDNLSSYLEFFNRSRFYSFDSGEIHLVSLDTNKIDQEQLSWLEEDLAKSASKVKVAFFHHPPFSSGIVHGGNEQVQEKFVPLFAKYAVKLVFSGHEHNYERLEVGGITYIVSGGGGKSIYPFGLPTDGSQARLADYHFVKVALDGCSAKTSVIRLDGSQFDPVTFKVC